MKTWQKLMGEVRKLAKAGRASLYERVGRLVKIAADPEFVRDVTGEGKNPTVVINDEISDSIANFTELRDMLEMFPSKDQWVNGNLAEMRAAAVKARIPPKKVKEQVSFTATVPNGRKSEEKEELVEIASVEQKSWKEEALKNRETIRQLRAEVRQLKAENKDLKDILKGFSRKQRRAS
jgi:hypothetical protein